jgi:hypothetical protein
VTLSRCEEEIISVLYDAERGLTNQEILKVAHEEFGERGEITDGI